MEGIGSEVSQKIRAAIKAKLIELGAYVDDELPDYIMVMVANKRTKSQMDEDLQLFLTSNTKIFTSWLHTVLQKLQEVTVASFEGKKDTDGKKSSMRKKLETEDVSKSRKSVDISLTKEKKHSKKHKENKKAKKNKHKSKEKVKTKAFKKVKEESQKISETKTSHVEEKNIDKRILDISLKAMPLELNETAENSAVKNFKKENLKSDILSHSSANTDALINDITKNKREPEGTLSNKEKDKIVNGSMANVKIGSESGGRPLIEDEFNIEPLKPTEKTNEKDFDVKCPDETSIINECRNIDYEAEKTISVPTEELLKEHNKLQSKELEVEEKNERKVVKSESEDSISPEEMRKQLLLSRAKKKLENCKLAERMRSNSPDVLILEEPNKIISKDFYPSPREYRENSFYRTSNVDSKLKQTEEKERKDVEILKTKNSVTSYARDGDKKETCDNRERRKNVIKISESLEMEKNLGIKKEREKSREREASFKKRSISSRVVTITGPEPPEISSIVKVKPREFRPKDKQANKALILKAVADAEKSIATVQTRIDPEPEPKKEALFTKNLRGKRYGKLAVTLSNIQKSPDIPDRRISEDSDKCNKSRMKLDSSEVSESVRGKSGLLSRKLSKSEDQFISSKTTVMEKNEKYIRCWLEGVEKATKEDEMVYPNELEDLVINSNLTDEENEHTKERISDADDERARKRRNIDDPQSEKLGPKNQKLSDTDIANLRVIPNSKGTGDGPQIVVTLDGLDAKTIKDIILRNKESVNGPILSTAKKCAEKDRLTREKVTARLSRDTSPTNTKKLNFEKISDRFGRLNKTNVDVDIEIGNAGKKSSKTHTFDKEKSSTESKNRQLIAQLSEKFGKVDREFENKKRKHPEEERKYLYDSRKSDREDSDRNGKYKRTERRYNRDDLSPSSNFLTSTSTQICKFYPNCKHSDCRYFHPKKCRFDDDCANPDCKYIHLEPVTKKSKWYSKS